MSNEPQRTIGVPGTLRVDLDRTATEEQKQIAQEIFGVSKIGVRGRYALEVDPLIELTKNLAQNVGASAIWDLAKWAGPLVTTYLSRKLVRSAAAAVVICRIEGSEVHWELRYHSDRKPSETDEKRLLEAADSWLLPEDTARVSINLIEKKISAFDSTGLRIGDFSWPLD